MAKLMAVGVGFPFSVSFRGFVGVVCLLGWGTGKVIAVGCVSFASCLLLGNVCKGVVVVGNIYSANAVVCYIYIRVTPAETLTNPLTKL
jgi:hypothetical protein